jgi:hypothetical protein
LDVGGACGDASGAGGPLVEKGDGGCALVAVGAAGVCSQSVRVGGPAPLPQRLQLLDRGLAVQHKDGQAAVAHQVARPLDGHLEAPRLIVADLLQPHHLHRLHPQQHLRKGRVEHVARLRCSCC